MDRDIAFNIIFSFPILRNFAIDCLVTGDVDALLDLVFNLETDTMVV
jgi:hypothetical protein